ncbi:MAG: ABC transporter substrate-binding protein, partial [Defluviitaleaceae bacterium]|nr:ABC transporter substrate-binding protein [Defluviitaleaceae bacterium]
MKKIVLLALLVFAVAAFAACTSDDETPAGGEANQRRTLVMGTNASFFPFEFIADYGRGVIGQYAGIDVSLVARIAEELDLD